jgi:hypothetical protein
MGLEIRHVLIDAKDPGSSRIDDAATPTSATTQPQLSGGALGYLLTLIFFSFLFTLANYSEKYFTKKEMYSNFQIVLNIIK